MKTRNVVFALAGAAVLVLKGHYGGPGRELVQSYAGNFSVSFALYFAARSATDAFRWPRVAAAGAVLVAVTAFELTDGFGFMANVFDTWDLVANLAGIACAALVDRATGSMVSKSPAPTRGNA